MVDLEDKCAKKIVKDVLLLIVKCSSVIVKWIISVILVWLPLCVSVILAIHTTPLCHLVLPAFLIFLVYFIGTFSFLINIMYTFCLICGEQDIGNFIELQRMVSIFQAILIVALSCFYDYVGVVINT